MKFLTAISLRLRRWHKRIGIFAALFFVFLASTGLLLNHAEAINLDKNKVKAPWLMQWYGLKTKVPNQGFHNNDTLSAFGDEAWVVAGKNVAAGRGDPIGVVSFGGNYWVATPIAVSIYQHDGQLVDRMDPDALPALPIRRIGVRQDKAVIDTPHGAYESSDGLNWLATRINTAIIWSHAAPLNPSEKALLSSAFAPNLPAQRIISDLHSGHIWGSYGVLVTDAIAAAILLLAFSGTWIHLKNSAFKRRHAGQVIQSQQQGNNTHHALHVRSSEHHQHGIERYRHTGQ